MKCGIFIFGIFFLACSQQKESPKINQEENEKTSIRLKAQYRPGGEYSEFDMPIDKGMETLEFASVADVELESDDLVIGIQREGETVAIPMRFLSGFEVANVKIGNKSHLVTWCPLVGTARLFEGALPDNTDGFDFGRGLINNNLLIIDRKTKTVWNQLSCKAVHGTLQGEQLNPLPSMQTTWGFWSSKYPDTKLMINQDTTDAVFSSLVFTKPYYVNWVQGERFPSYDKKEHDVRNLGLRLDLDGKQVYFPFEVLSEKEEAFSYSFGNQELTIHVDAANFTAWVEDSSGDLLPHVLVYQKPWLDFYPETTIVNEI